MATFPLTDAYFEANSVDLSSWVRSISFPQGTETVDDTAMGDTHRSEAPSLKTWSISVEFNQDFAASAVDATLNALVGTTTAIEIRPDSAAVSATNPKWTGTALVAEYNPVQGRVGEMAIATLELRSAGTLTRATS